MEVVLTVLAGAGPALLREIGRTPVLADGLNSGLDEATAARLEEVRLTLPPERAALDALRGLRTAVAASIVLTSPAPRPSGLLATEAERGLRAALEAIAWQRPRVRFTGLRLEAAGSHTPLMRQLAESFAQVAGVPVADDGDLAVRVRRSPAGGWEALVRTTARPLATRAWRTERYPGALNATIAAAVVDELGVSESDVFADLMCGSGTLVIERLARGPARRTLACDVSPEALAVLTRHLRTARVRGRVEQVCASVAELGAEGGAVALPDGVAPARGTGADGAVTRGLRGQLTHIVANPPWGELLGEHETNDRLYAELLDAVDNLGAPQVRAGILTHDIRRFERVLERDPRWRLVARPQFFAKGHRPRLFVLVRA